MCFDEQTTDVPSTSTNQSLLGTNSRMNATICRRRYPRAVMRLLRFCEERCSPGSRSESMETS